LKGEKEKRRERGSERKTRDSGKRREEWKSEE